MRNLATLLLFLLISVIASAQETSVTKFLGIPIDGTKGDMIRKIEAKGFTYHSESNVLTGEFNGEEVLVSVGTNGNKVFRVCVMPIQYSSEAQIKIKYDNLIGDFINNGKYIPLSSDSVDDVDLGNEMWLYHKNFQAIFIQLPTKLTDPTITNDIANYLKEKYTPEQLRDTLFLLTKIVEAEKYIATKYSNNIVWASIYRDSREKFKIILYYDNRKNQSHGEDL